MNTIITCICAVATAFTPVSAELNEYVCAYESVNSAYCVIYGDEVLVTVQTQPFFTRSQYTEFKNKLAEDVKAKFGYASVTVCSDSDLFYKAKKAASMGMSESEAAALIESALKRK